MVYGLKCDCAWGLCGIKESLIGAVTGVSERGKERRLLKITRGVWLLFHARSASSSEF